MYQMAEAHAVLIKLHPLDAIFPQSALDACLERIRALGDENSREENLKSPRIGCDVFVPLYNDAMNRVRLAPSPLRPAFLGY